MTTKPIAYVAPDAYAFVRKDVEGLRALGVVVHDHCFEAQKAWQLPMAFVNQLRFLIKAKRHGVRHVISHFAGHHSVLPTLLGFRTHIIIAGADACSFPGIGYGSFRKPLMRFAMAYSMRNASTLLPVHESLRRFKNTFSNFGPAEQGYSHFVNGLNTAERPLPYGFDVTLWPSRETPTTRSGAICIAMGASAGNSVHFRKGVDLIVEAARSLPGIPFTVIGATQPESYTGLPTNVRLIGRVGQSDLRELYQAHSIYLQPSVMEGFPNALCEAMLCGCLPVVSAITSMPSIIGDTGVIITERKREALIAAINALLAAAPEAIEARRKVARERILPYSMQRRMDGLRGAIGQSE